MKTYTQEEVNKLLESGIKQLPEGTEGFDNYGQIVIYTGIYRWEDGTYHDEEEPNRYEG